MKINLRDKTKFFLTHWDWTFLNWCFPDSSIRVEDIDGHIEHKGYHLWIETKLPGVAIPYSQEVTHLTLMGEGNNTLLVIWGENNEAEKVRLYTMQGAILEGAASNIDLAFLVRGWFLHVSDLPQLNAFYEIPIPAVRIKPIRRLLDKLHTTIGDNENEK